MYTLTADSGSTKTTWLLTADSGASLPHITTQGINPFHMSPSDMRRIISDELLPAIAAPQLTALPQGGAGGGWRGTITEIHFYGAGCTPEKSPILRDILASLFPSAQSITVDSDMLGAAKALFADQPGIACILGTGANSCLYDGKQIVANISPMGYILGDEGSGAVIGKTFLNALYKGPHRDFIPTFERETGLTLPDIINKVYREPLPNRFLASLAPFIHSHLEDQQWIAQHVTQCFRDFFRNNVSHYTTHLSSLDLRPSPLGGSWRGAFPVGFVGSIAFHFREQLLQAAAAEGYTVSKILKEPLQ
jgi:N-acetylglucosamine kinase-like BadF-type ATPase